MAVRSWRHHHQQQIDRPFAPGYLVACVLLISTTASVHACFFIMSGLQLHTITKDYGYRRHREASNVRVVSMRSDGVGHFVCSSGPMEALKKGKLYAEPE